jgi:hypothetical protein
VQTRSGVLALRRISPDRGGHQGFTSRSRIPIGERHVGECVGHSGTVHRIPEAQCCSTQVPCGPAPVSGGSTNAGAFLEADRCRLAITRTNCLPDGAPQRRIRARGNHRLADCGEPADRAGGTIQIARCPVGFVRPLRITQLASYPADVKRDLRIRWV